jgi:hypothetical protein
MNPTGVSNETSVRTRYSRLALWGFLLLCACGPPPPIRLQSPALAIYGAFDPEIRTPTVRHVAGELDITVEEFVTADKSRPVFDADLADYGVLALFVAIANNGSSAYDIGRGAIRALMDAQPLTPLTASEAAAQSTARVFEMRLKGQDAAYALMTLTPPGLVIVGSYWLDCLGNKDCGFNKERERRREAIEYDRAHIPLQFEKREFPYGSVPPGKKASGFVYFKLFDERENLLVRITLEVNARKPEDGGDAQYRFALIKAAK